MTSTLKRAGTSTATRQAVAAMYAGLALTVIALALAVVNRVSGYPMSDPPKGKYLEYDAAQLDAAKSASHLYLFAIGVVGILTWLLMIRAVRNQKAWTKIVAPVIFLLATVDALLNLVLEEYGNKIVPMPLALVTVLPCVAGLVAVVLIWKRGSTR